MTSAPKPKPSDKQAKYKKPLVAVERMLDQTGRSHTLILRLCAVVPP